MISFRNGFFETNSSSVHVLVIPKDTEISIPKAVYLSYGKYGWGYSKEYDTLDYFYQACVDAGKEELEKLFSYLYRKGVEVIHCRELDNPDEELTWENGGFVDHGNEIPLDELFANETLLDRFLFGIDSYVQTGNDNSYECPSAEDYDPDIYDTIEKGN